MRPTTGHAGLVFSENFPRKPVSALTNRPPQSFRMTRMMLRGVRGATTVEANTRDEILAATRQLVALMIRLNGIEPEHVASAIFSATHDLDAEFPALAARQ